MSLRSGSRATLKSAGASRPINRAESVKSFGGMRMIGTAVPSQRRDIKGAALEHNNKNTAVVTLDDIQRIREQCALVPMESDFETM